MYRRQFAASTVRLVATLGTVGVASRFQATPATSGCPRLEIILTDTGFKLPDPIRAGRHEITVTNTGTSTESHYFIARIPEAITDAEFEAWLQSKTGETEALGVGDLTYVDAADWPQPGGPEVKGFIDLQPGRHIIAYPMEGMIPMPFVVEGSFHGAAEPASDLTVDLNDMVVTLPDTALTSAPVRWKIQNTGTIEHEVAVLPVPAELTEDHLMTMLALPWDATPPPDIPTFQYLPVAAIGILSAGGTSWLDVQLSRGRYLAACMLPFGTGYPHAMDGMYVFFDIT